MKVTLVRMSGFDAEKVSEEKCAKVLRKILAGAVCCPD